MKEVKSYKCDFCGTVYATESECKKNVKSIIVNL